MVDGFSRVHHSTFVVPATLVTSQHLLRLPL
jgi:hypothetical protein